MALSHSTALAHAILDAGFNPQFDGQILEFRSGVRPANADTAPTGTVLATFTLPAALFPAAASRKLTAAAIAAVTAALSGTATWFRMRLPGDLGTTNTTDKRLDGDISTIAAATGDVQLDNTAITANGQVTISSLVYNHPA